MTTDSSSSDETMDAIRVLCTHERWDHRLNAYVEGLSQDEPRCLDCGIAWSERKKGPVATGLTERIDQMIRQRDAAQQALQQARAERDALAFRVAALREGLQDVMGVDPRSDAMWFIADNALKVDDDRARQALTSMERGRHE